MKPLVDYSDSDQSGDETPAPAQADQAKEEQKQPPAASKSTVPKLVDGTNPAKITVNISAPAAKHAIEPEAPPAKKQKTSGGGGGIFANMKNALPAPKKTGNLPVKRGLGSGVSLKTGADRAFSKERVTVESTAPAEESRANGTADTTKHEEKESTERKADDNMPAWKKPDYNPWNNVPLFKPQAVLQAEAKKKKKVAAKAPAAAAAAGSAPATSSLAISASETTSKPNVAFNLGLTPQFEPDNKPPPAKAGYEPMFHKPAEPQGTTDRAAQNLPSAPAHPSKPPDPHGLDSLNLSASDRRVLFGRKGKVPEGIDFKTFNVDEQYAANQEFARSGEAVQAKYAPLFFSLSTPSLTFSPRQVPCAPSNQVNTHSVNLSMRLRRRGMLWRKVLRVNRRKGAWGKVVATGKPSISYAMYERIIGAWKATML